MKRENVFIFTTILATTMTVGLMSHTIQRKDETISKLETQVETAIFEAKLAQKNAKEAQDIAQDSINQATSCLLASQGEINQ